MGAGPEEGNRVKVAESSAKQTSATNDLGIEPSQDPRGVASFQGKKMRFATLTREQQIALFQSELAGYPEGRELLAAPHISWDQVPACIMTSLLWGAASKHPERWIQTLAAGVVSSLRTLRDHSIVVHLSGIRRLHDFFHERLGINGFHGMTLDGWESIGRDQEAMRKLGFVIQYYATLDGYMRQYQESLSEEQSKRLTAFFLPPMPVRYIERFVPIAAINHEQRERRKAKTDVLSEVAPFLLALILQRQKSALRFLEWARTQVALAEAGKLDLPARIVYDDTELDVCRYGRTLLDTNWRERPVHAEFLLWTPDARIRRLMAAEEGRMSSGTKSERKKKISQWMAYGRERYLLEICSNPTDGPWFLPAAARKAYFSRTVDGRSLKGEYATPSGVGAPFSRLANWVCHQDMTALEPEALYRAALFGSAFAVTGLTSSARVGELLQISADRWQASPHIVKDKEGKVTRKTVIFLQSLLPKGRFHDSERNLYNVSAAYPLLKEITLVLEGRHGGRIPVVPLNPLNDKARDVSPERYLFQWAGRSFSDTDANALIKFVLDGIQFRDSSGEPFDVTVHVLRHVGATAARQDYGVPGQVMADVLAHRHPDGQTDESTAYYTLKPRERSVREQHDALMRFMDDVERSVSVPADPTMELQQLLARYDQETRELVSRWHTWHPVVFGLCGRPGLCVRGTVRSLCLGCQHLILRPECKGAAVLWKEAYETMAEGFERDGNAGEALEHRDLAYRCAFVLHEMELLEQAEQDGWGPPYGKALGPGTRQLPEAEDN